MEEPLYAALQREVQRKLGRCLIRIQQYELLLKEIVAKREVSAIPGRKPLQFAEPTTAVAAKTMGQLVGELTDTYFQPTMLESGQTQPDSSFDDHEHPAGWSRVRMSVSMPTETHAQLTDELKELVNLRNDLVHHFIEGQDLVTEEGCVAADMYLQDCYSEIDRHLVSLQGWADSSNEVNRSMTAFMEGPEFKAFLLAELSPPTSQREAALPGFVMLLRKAEANLAQEGWTALNAAIALIKEVAPDETPRKHSFSNWREVLHHAPTFEVRRLKRESGETMETWYRSRIRY